MRNRAFGSTGIIVPDRFVQIQRASVRLFGFAVQFAVCGEDSGDAQHGILHEMLPIPCLQVETMNSQLAETLAESVI